MGKKKAEGPRAIAAILSGDIPQALEDATISGRLRKKFGLGGNPVARQRLYDFCEAAVKQHGEPAYQAISEAVAQAVHARRDPGHYFSRAVKMKLRERGLGGQTEADESW